MTKCPRELIPTEKDWDSLRKRIDEYANGSVGIINYIGNIGSVKNALDYLEIPNCIVNIPEQLKDCTHIIIPGVGNWTEGVKRLKPFYKYLKSTKKPILGICLGHQLLAKTSEEGEGKGLGLINTTIKKTGRQHVGWERIGKKYYYFTHGYVMMKPQAYLNQSIWEIKERNIQGCQFHPEKSQKDGLDYLKQWWEGTK